MPIDGLLITFGQPFFQGILIVLYGAIIGIALIANGLVQLMKLSNALTVPIRKTLSSVKSRVARISEDLTAKSSLQTKKLLSVQVHIRKTKPQRRIPAKAVVISLAAFTLLTGIIIFLLGGILKDLPSPDRLKDRKQIVSTKIYDRNGNLLFKIFKNENRTLDDLEDIPPFLIQATIAIEDKDFYKHPGYSYKGILRAIRDMVKTGNLQSGSTITQQLVKNALLSKEKTVKRKVKEIILAILVEMKFTKDEILTMYFNEVGYGGAAYGIEEAAQMYFNKPARELNLEEAALLAGLPAAPTRYSPFGTHPETAKFRQHEVLRRMVEEGYLTEKQAEKAKADQLIFASQKTDIKAPHFVMYVKSLLVEKFGEQVVEQGGLEVQTSLDLQIQRLAEEAVEKEVSRLSNLNIQNGAALVTNPKTGEILAMVGSRNFFDFEHDGQVNVTIRPRQPGSVIKPINYAVALEGGMTAATLLTDSPITYQIPGQPPYSPKNYDGKYHGKVSLREALANSYNIPAVKTLAVFGVEKMVEKGKAMGITTWDSPSRYGLSLTLGGGEVKMVDLAVAYASLANAGNRIDLAPILKISDGKGRVLFKYACDNFQSPNEKAKPIEEVVCNPKPVVKPEVAFIETSILADNIARSRAFGRRSVLNIPGHEVAVKTGTTQNLRDNWTIGYTDDVLVSSWVGNNDNTQMSYVASGITGASPIWSTIMTTLLAEKPPHRFETPQTIARVAVCHTTGTLPCEGCPQYFEYFIPGTQPTNACLPKTEGEEEGGKALTEKEDKVQVKKPKDEKFGRILGGTNARPAL